MPTTLSPKEVDKLFRVPTNGRFRLKDHDTGWAGGDYFQDLSKDELKERAQSYLTENLEELAAAQGVLYATDRHSVLVVLQAMDAAGKDGTIKHVMSGVNPQGCQVFSFKKPSAEDLDHNFLWRYSKCLPERGRIGIFNRSYYEDVLVVKVHPELIGREVPRKGFLGALGFMDEKAMRAKAKAGFEELGGTVRSYAAPVGSMSGGQRQQIAIVRAISWANKLVFLDEPTAALGVVQTKNVLDTIKRVRDKGIAVVLISHSMPEVLEVADRIQVMRLGTRVATLPSEGTTVEQLVGAMTGALDFSKEELA